MEIDINQKKISFGEKYKIFTGGVQTHYASSKIFRWLTEINLFDFNTGQQKLTLKKRFAWFNAKYDITLADNSLLEFRTISFWGLHYQCILGPNVYDIFGHRGRKYSVFKNNVQIAWWDRKAVAWFKGNNYKITTDPQDNELIIAFCLVIDDFTTKKQDNKALNIDFGNLGFWARKFDKMWYPKG